MTVSDIDDAMGWPPGTARRRRWRAPQRGGLPSADVELGGVAIWFHSTIEHWQAHLPRIRPRDDPPADHTTEPRGDDDMEPVTAPDLEEDDQFEAVHDAEPDDEHPPDPEGDLVADWPDAQRAGSPVGGGALHHDVPGGDEVLGDDGTGEEPDHEHADHLDVGHDEVAVESGDDGSGDGDQGDEPAGSSGEVAVATGFELEPGRRVLAEVHRRWREAHVVHCDRATVVVEYSLDDTPRGARRQRIDIQRVRISPEPS